MIHAMSKYAIFSACASTMLLAGTVVSAQCLPGDVYGPAITAPSGNLPLGVAAGDLNNDGNADIVTSNFFGNTISIIMGNGDGTFAATTDILLDDATTAFLASAVHITIGDLNADGWADIAVAVQAPDLGNPGVAILLNDGAGGFAGPPEYYAFSTQIRDIVIVDIDANGTQDIVYANRDDDTVNVVLGNGDGTFQNEIFSEFSGGPVGVVIRDFNGDGFLDVASPLVFSSEIVIAMGNGTSTLTEFTRLAADSPEGIGVGDINGDGNYDLVIPFLNGAEVQYFLGNGDGTFGAKQILATGAGTLPFASELSDVNGDGFDDILVGLFIAGTVEVFLSNGDGTFQAVASFPAGDRIRYLAFSDFDNNGVDDIVAANGAIPGSATVLLNQCPGSQPCVADVNGDGTLSAADFTAWIAAFNANAPECDQNGDGLCTAADFTAWIANFNAGC